MCQFESDWVAELLQLIDRDIQFPAVSNQVYLDEMPYQELLRSLEPEQRRPIIQYVKDLQLLEACLTRMAYSLGYEKALKANKGTESEDI